MNVREHPKITSYLKKITQHVKNKKAHEQIQLELLSHLEERIEEELSEGVWLEEAIDKAIEQLGDSAVIGQQFHRTYKQAINWPILSLLLVFIGFGLFLMFALDHDPSQAHGSLFTSKLIAVGAGLGLLIPLLFFDYRKLKKYSYYLFAANQLIVLLIIFMRHSHNGRPMLPIFNTSIDYISTVSPILNIIAVAGILTLLNPSRKSNQLILAGLFLIPAFLYFNTPALSAMIVYFFAFVILVLKSSLRKKYLLLGFGVVLSFLAFLFLKHYPVYAWGRIFGFLKPYEDAGGYGYYYVQSIEIIKSSGWWGNWFAGDGITTLPELQNLFIFTYIIYQFGWVLSSCFVLLCLYFIYRILKLFDFVSDQYGTFLITGIVTILSIQFFWSIGMTLSILPIMNVGFPLISNGGTHFLMSMLCIGLLLSIYRNKSFTLIQPSVT